MIPTDAGSPRATGRDGAVHVRKGGRWVASQAMGGALAALAALSTLGIGVIEQTAPSVYSVKQATFGHSGGRWTAAGTFTGDRSFTFQDASGTVALLESAQTFTAAQTVRAATGITTLQAATQDAMRLIGRAGGTSSYVHTQTVAAQSASQTVTWPDATGVPAISSVALTSGRVPYVTAGGLLIDAATLLFNGTHTLSVVGATQANLNLDGASGNVRSISFFSGGSARWRTRASSGAESGANAGSDWQHVAFDDAGTQIDTPITITRAAGGNITLVRPLATSGIVAISNNGSAATPALRIGSAEVHGLYRISASAVGLSINGAAGLQLGSSSILAQIASAGSYAVGSSVTDGAVVFMAGTSTTAGGQLRVYGSTHATKADYRELCRGSTVDMTLNGSGNVLIAASSVVGGTTFVGSERLRVAGGSAATSGATDVCVGAGIIDMGVSLRYRGTQVVGAPKTGWTAWTGTPLRTTQNAADSTTASAGYVQAEVQAINDRLTATRQRLAALIDDLLPAAGHGLLAA